MDAIGTVAGYEVEIVVQGFPGKSKENGGLGWSTIALLRGYGRVILVDTGSFSTRQMLLRRLRAHGIERGDVTDILLTHAHYDHMMNWCAFPVARIWINADELAWALADPVETSLCAELYVRELARSDQLRRIERTALPLPGIRALHAPGHTPHHLIFVLEEASEDGRRMILAGDAAKNRAEILSGQSESTLDATASADTIRRVRALWEERTGTILVPGHDLPMISDERGGHYIGERRAKLLAWLGESANYKITIPLSND